jgi:tryptophanyl-tRNA synthetase
MTDSKTISKGRILSGMRPTGKLHLGNYVGALRNWVGLQDDYECFFFIADWHALTTDYADTRSVKQNSLEVILDYLAAGLDPGTQHAVHPVACAATCRVAPAVQHDYAVGMAGARAQL